MAGRPQTRKRNSRITRASSKDLPRPLRLLGFRRATVSVQWRPDLGPPRTSWTWLQGTHSSRAASAPGHTSVSAGSISFLAEIEQACVYFLITLLCALYGGCQGEEENVALRPFCATQCLVRLRPSFCGHAREGLRMTSWEMLFWGETCQFFHTLLF